jgi:predicted NAD/FAD-binding protein
MIGFCRNHGLLQLRDRPRWKTIVGGAKQYVSALMQPLRGKVRLSCPVQSVTRTPDHVVIRTTRGDAQLFDQVIFASHADQTLRMLADATPLERRVLSAFPYQRNDAVLHTDAALLPRRPRAWASWNYHVPRDGEQNVTVTYDLSRLQGLASPAPILLTLNHTGPIDEAKVIKRFSYTHPAYSRESIAAQREHAKLNGANRAYFCGAYWGYGFHEDGVNSALAVARCFGQTWETWKAVSTKAASSIAASSH